MKCLPYLQTEVVQLIPIRSHAGLFVSTAHWIFGGPFASLTAAEGLQRIRRT